MIDTVELCLPHIPIKGICVVIEEYALNDAFRHYSLVASACEGNYDKLVHLLGDNYLRSDLPGFVSCLAFYGHDDQAKKLCQIDNMPVLLPAMPCIKRNVSVVHVLDVL